MGPKFLGFLPDRVWELLWAAPISIAIWIGLARNLPGIMEKWNERRRIRAEERAADWVRRTEEIARLTAAKHALELENADLRKERDQIEDGRLHWMERAIRAEAFLHGQGFVREAAAVAAAEVRRDARASDGDIP